MFFVQKGIIPTITTAAGLVCVSYSAGAVVYFLQGSLVAIVEAARDSQWSALFPVAGAFALLSAFLIYSLGFSGMFPAISLTDRGIRLRHPLRFSMTVPWEKVEGVVERIRVPGCAAIIISHGPLGMLFPGRYYFNYMFGFLACGMRPVVLLAGNLASNQVLLDEIRQRARAPGKSG